MAALFWSNSFVLLKLMSIMYIIYVFDNESKL